jgi:hypothetical protein
MNQPPEPPPSPLKHGCAAWARPLCFAALGAYLICAAGILSWGAYQRFHLQQTPVIDPDITGYLGPAISGLVGKGFIHMKSRSFPYPGFLWLILKTCGNFRAISLVQHTLGVATGALTLLAWNAMLRLVPAGGIPRQLSRFMGLAPAAMYLGSIAAIHFEQEIRPEAIFPFFTILNLYLSFLFIHSRFVRRESSIWLGGLNVFVAAIVYMLRPSFGLATVFSTLPVWLSLILPGPGLRQKGALLAAAILPAALLLFLPEQILARIDVYNRLAIPQTLFTVHARMILDQMSGDLASNAQTPYPRAILQSATDLLRLDFQKATSVTITKKAYPSLGFNPDYLRYDSFCNEFQNMKLWDADGYARFYDFYYIRTAREQPRAMMQKILAQMRIFYCLKNSSYRLGRTMPLAAEYARPLALIGEVADIAGGYPPLAQYLADCSVLAKNTPPLVEARRVTKWAKWLSANYLYLLFIALLSPIALFFPSLRRHLAWLVVCLWLAFSYNFGNCLTISVVHSLDVGRFARIQLLFTEFSQFLCLYFIFEALFYILMLLFFRKSLGADRGVQGLA